MPTLHHTKQLANTYLVGDYHNGTRLTTKALRQAQVDHVIADIDAKIAYANMQSLAWHHFGTGDQCVTNFSGWCLEEHRLRHQRASILAFHAKRELTELCRKQGKRGSR